jgi:hypothetical protein
METKQPTPRKPRHVNWDRVNALSSLALAIVGFAALAFTWKQIDDMKSQSAIQIIEMRSETQMEHLTALIDKYDSAEWVSNRKALALKRVDSKNQTLVPLDVNDAPMELYDELGFCDDIGLLTTRGYLDRHDVWSSFGDWISLLYADARPLLDSEQKKSPADYRECTNLAESMRQIEAKEDAGADNNISKDDILGNYLGDIDSEAGQPPRRGKLHRNP